MTGICKICQKGASNVEILRMTRICKSVEILRMTGIGKSVEILRMTGISKKNCVPKGGKYCGDPPHDRDFQGDLPGS